MRGALGLVCLLTGCGRLGFDFGDTGAPTDARIDTTPGGDADAPGGGPSMIGLAQQSPAVALAGGDVIMTLPAPSTAGSLLVAAFGTNDTSNLVLPSGWTIAAQVIANGGCFAVIAFLADNPGGITTVTLGQPSGLPSVAQLTEWTGVSTTGALDAVGMATSSNPVGSQSVQTSMATTAPDAVAITAFCEAVNTPTYTAGAGWTNLTSYSNSSSSPSFTSDYLLGIGPGVIGETVTSSVSGKYAAVIATFRAL